ncbi:MAG: hypothetical protein WKG32_05230, partial [Gemmatimonadaceae bacterium]
MNRVVAIFWYLARCSFGHRVGRQLRRLRRPRYVVAFLIGVAYVGLIIFRPAGTMGGVGGRFGGSGAELASLALVLLAGRWWLFGGERSALAFSSAEVYFLFPAPLTRR